MDDNPEIKFYIKYQIKYQISIFVITTFHSCHRYEYFKPNLNIKTQNQKIFDSAALVFTSI